MLRHIIDKEIRDLIGTTKFTVMFAVCSLLILLAFFMGGTSYLTARAQYEADRSENLRQFEGLTDWMRVHDFRVFLPPQPLASLVPGITNDIGRTAEVTGSGEAPTEDSRYGDEPVFAIFRLLDLGFVFEVVLTLFAIMSGYDAVNGEKERGTLRLTFAYPLPRHTYILGKLLGSLLGLGVPLLIPLLAGCLLLAIMGIPLRGEEWLSLTGIIAAGMLLFCVFLTLAILVSSLTRRSADSFLIVLVVWIMAVLIVPRAAVVLAGRAVDVPGVDEIASQKARLNAQIWKEDRKALNTFSPAPGTDPSAAVTQINTIMQEAADNRAKKMEELTARLNEDRANRQAAQKRLAFGLARISPSAMFSLAASSLAGTSTGLEQRFHDALTSYQDGYGRFMKEKTGVNLGAGVMMIRMIEEEGTTPEPINPAELPVFTIPPQPFADQLASALPDMGLLGGTLILLFAASVLAFQRYDVR